MKSTAQTYFEIRNTLAHTRGLILNTLEYHFGDTKEWAYVRNRILSALGQKGLEGRLNTILMDLVHNIDVEGNEDSNV